MPVQTSFVERVAFYTLKMAPSPILFVRGMRQAEAGGNGRFAPLLQGVYYLLVMMILPPILTGSNEPTLLTESLWMATWFLMSLALWQQAKESAGYLLASGD